MKLTTFEIIEKDFGPFIYIKIRKKDEEGNIHELTKYIWKS